MYSVYKLDFPNGKVYIGMTSTKPEIRWKKGKGYHNSNQELLEALKKYNWNDINHNVLFQFETKEEAEQKEKDLIKQYNALDEKFGYNRQEGGTSGYTIHEKTKKIFSQQRSGKNNYWYGKTLTESHKKHISESKKGLKYGGALSNMRRVAQYDLNNNFIKDFESLTTASKELNIPYQNISMCCRNIIHKTHDYIFKYIY